MPTATIGTATVGTTQVAATAFTGWDANTKCNGGVRVFLPVGNTDVVYVRYVTGPNNLTAAIAIPKGVVVEITPAALAQGGLTPTLSNLFFVAGAASQAVTAEAIS